MIDMSIFTMIPKFALLKEFQQRYPRFDKVITIAANCNVMAQGGTMFQNMTTGEMVAQLPGAVQEQATATVTDSKGTVTEAPITVPGEVNWKAYVDKSIKSLRTEVNQTFGRTVDKMVGQMRSEADARHKEILSLMAPKPPARKKPGPKPKGK
tara:strand:- start:600 stop:1058 length:459 start_codon:yes stop_codon:yes gene_type:complete